MSQGSHCTYYKKRSSNRPTAQKGHARIDTNVGMTQTDPNRRLFLKSAAAATLAAGSFAGNARGANERIRLAFIGVGRAGSRNIDFAAATPGFEIAAVCDVCDAALDRAVQKAGHRGFRDVKATRDFREILADRSIDAVAIAAPDHWHACLSVEACKAGKDVWLETPVCVYVEEGARMIEAARRYRRVVQVGAIERSGSLFRQIRAILRRGDLGDIAFCRSFHARISKREGSGHPPDSDPPLGLNWLLDLVSFAFEEAMPSRIAAQGGPDTMLVTCRYPSLVASCETRTLDPDSRCADFRGATIYGSEATLVIHRSGYAVYLNRQANARMVECSSAEGSADSDHWKDFRDCIRSRRKPVGDIESCVRSTIPLLLADVALRHGMALDWDQQAFTVKQPEARCFLKMNYRAPRNLKAEGGGL
jgi:predicted dehydrogenase